MTADERPDPGAIDRGDAAHIHDQVPLSAAKELLNVLLERFGGSAAYERHLRRKDEAVGGSCRIGHCAVRELYTAPGLRVHGRSRPRPRSGASVTTTKSSHCCRRRPIRVRVVPTTARHLNTSRSCTPSCRSSR